MTVPELVPCRSCDALIWWAVTEAEQRMIPVNPAPDADRGNLVILRSWGGQAVVRVLRGDEMPPSAAGVTAYLPHHATCPNAAAHRRPHGTRTRHVAGRGTTARDADPCPWCGDDMDTWLRAAGWTGHIGCPPLTSAELELEAALAAAADLPPTFSRRHAA